MDQNYDVGTYISIKAKEYGVDLTEWNLDEAPLRNLAPPDHELEKRARKVFQRSRAPLHKAYNRLLQTLSELKSSRALGASTAGKLAYIRDISGTPYSRLSTSEIEESFISIYQRTLELLDRQLDRLGVGHLKVNLVRSIRQQTEQSVEAEDFLYHRLREICSRDPRDLVTFESFFASYWDQVVHVFEEFHVDSVPYYDKRQELRSDSILSARYAQRDPRFLKLGDLYGDCTAEVARQGGRYNIHDCVYGWMLDPHYRILEILYDGRPALKGHITPMIVEERACLMLDAVEAVPKLRPYIGGQRNRFVSTDLLLASQEILELLFETAMSICRRMNAECVLVEPFSNAAWIRDAITRLPSVFVQVNRVVKPHGTDCIKRMIQEQFGECEPFHFEIQATNEGLMYQGLRSGWKELHLLCGNFSSSRAAVCSGP
ncbi:MAG: hypothetical protein AAGB04_00725 [Pseudomonadota bacterium]